MFSHNSEGGCLLQWKKRLKTAAKQQELNKMKFIVSKKLKLLIIGFITVPLLYTITQFSFLLVSRSKNQKLENQRIIPIIGNSQKVFKRSLTKDGDTQITVLLENYRDPSIDGIKADHGISLLAERNGQKYILDMGESDSTLSNARALGIDLSNVRSVFISHGHIDHGGALNTFLKENKNVPVYMSTYAQENHYRLLFGFYKLNTGLNRNSPDLFDKYKERFRFIDQTNPLIDDIFVITDIQGPHAKPVANEGVLRETGDGNIEADDFSHEVAYVFKNKDGLIIYSGCNHNGLLNTLETVRDQFPAIPIKAVLGGFHLMNPITNKMAEEKETVEKIAQYLKQHFPDTYFYTGHCTGAEGYQILKSILQNKIEYFTSGSRFII